jgi:plasmid stabilization system protein ParE
MLPVEYLPDARRDFDESFDWYAKRSVLAAIRFASAIEAALDAIAAAPLRFPLLDRIHRESPVARFPFRIVYRIVADRIVVVAVVHAKRRPGYWRDRI